MKDKCNNERKSIFCFLWKYKAVTCTLIIIPILLSVACYFSIPYFNRAGSAAWLGFWGGYLGSAIMAAVTLYVLDRQLKQNHKENVCNAVLQIATLTNNEEKAQIDKLADALVDFQTSFDFLSINRVAERMLKGEYLITDIDRLTGLVRDVDCKGFKVDILLKPIPQSDYIKKYNTIYNGLYNGYGLLINDLISLIDIMKDLPKDKAVAKAMVIAEINNNKIINSEDLPNHLNIIGLKKPKSIFDIIEENKYYEDIAANASEIIKQRLMQSINHDAELKESLKAVIIDLLDYEYRCINDNFNEKIKVYEQTK